MADQRSRLTMEILARVRGTGEVDRLARAVDETGDEMSEAARDARQLDAAIDDVTDELQRLNRELLQTGDIDVLDKSRGVRSTLALLKRMRREIGDVEKAGRSLGDVLGSLPAQLKGGLIISLVAVAAAAAPLLAGAVSAAVIGGVGIGGIIGGVAAAAQDSRVKGAASAMVDSLGNEFKSLSPLFAEPVIRSLGILGDAATGLLRQVRPQLAALGPVTEQLAAGVAGLVRELGPGLALALQESVPILEALARELPGLGRDLRDVFGLLAGGGEDARDALIATVNLIGMMAKASASAIRGFTELFGLIRDVAQSPLAGGAVTQFAHDLLGIGDSTDRLNVKTKDLAGVYSGELDPALDDTAQTMEDQQRMAVLTADSLGEATTAAGGLSEALRILNGGVLSTRDAERAFQQAIDDATQSVKDNGRTLDINTDKGRDNQAALDRIADTAIQVADAVLEQTGSQKRANSALEDGRKALIRAARRMGLSRREARRLADELLGIPNNIGINVHTKYTESGRPPSFAPGERGGATRPGFQQRAEGGPVRKGDLTLVGERGPELVQFKQDGRVFSNSDSRRIARDMEAGGGMSGPRMSSPQRYVFDFRGVDERSELGRFVLQFREALRTNPAFRVEVRNA